MTQKLQVGVKKSKINLEKREVKTLQSYKNKQIPYF